MRRIIYILTLILLLAAMTIPVCATTGDGAAVISGATGVPGDTVELYVTLSGFDNADTLGVEIRLEEGLTLDVQNSGWLLDGALATIDGKNNAVWCVEDAAVDVNTQIMKLAVILPTPPEDRTNLNYQVTCTVTAVNGDQKETATSTGGIVSVKVPATQVENFPATMEFDILQDNEFQLEPQLRPLNTTDSVEWSSSAQEIVAVDQNGKLTILELGSATITLKAGNLEKKCIVTVKCSHDLENHPEVQPDCDTSGTNEYNICKECGVVLKADKRTVTTVDKEFLAATGHAPTFVEGEPATCVQEGNRAHYVCGNPGCVGKFYSDEACQITLDEVKLDIDPVAHVGETELRNAATASCYQDGHTGDVYCLSCDKIRQEGQSIQATGNHIAGAAYLKNDEKHWHVCTTPGCGKILNEKAHSFVWVTDEPATEDKVGTEHEECACGAKRNENTEIPKLPHQHVDIRHHSAQAPTCSKTGTVEYWTCGSDKCKDIFYGDAACTTVLTTVEVPVDPLNHVGETELRGAAQANCYQEGYTGDLYCKACGQLIRQGKKTEATGKHTAGDQLYRDDASHWYACTTDGCTAHVDQAAHDYKWKLDAEATEDAVGKKHEECVCGAKRNENTEIPKLDHKHVDIQHHGAVAATCVKTGTLEYWTCGSDKCKDKFYGDENCQLLLDTIEVPVNSGSHTGPLEFQGKKEPTCAEDGYSGDAYCGACQAMAEKGETVPATGKHTPQEGYTTNATHHWKVCSVCGAVIDDRKEGHTFAWVEDLAATEDSLGKKHEECACGVKRNENTEIPKLPHKHVNIQHHGAVAATCVKTGTVEHWTCGSDKCKGIFYGDADCRRVLESIETPIDADHHAGELELRDRKEATCSEQGYTGDSYCLDCGSLAKKGETILATGNHTPKAEYSKDETHHWQECSLCGTVIDGVKAGHEYAWIVDAEPTEEAEGSMHQACTVCGHALEPVAIDKLEHMPVWVPGTPAGCEQAGTLEHFHCDNCGRVYASVNGVPGEEVTAESLIVSPLGHQFGDTWYCDGTHHWKVCTCGAASEKTAHNGELVKALEATAEQEGYTGDQVCKDCGYVIQKGETIPKLQSPGGLGGTLILILVLVAAIAVVVVVLILRKSKKA